MPENPQVEELLEKLLDSGAAPEDVCRECPELLSQVQARWRRIRAVEAELGELFPESSSSGLSRSDVLPVDNLPQIRGYDVQAVLGRGGMGVVYKAWHLRLNRPVAIKMLLAGAHAAPQELERFLREAEAVAGLRHANIVQVYDVGDFDGQPYFTMEFVEGGSLAQKLPGIPLSPRQAANLVATLADAMQIAHQNGIVHRDLKPANILLTADGTPKITDFGLARRLEEAHGLTLTGAALGTLDYMAPEQARGQHKTIGPATDVYALGAILYELLTGRPPFLTETRAALLQQVLTDEPVRPSRLNARVPRDLETICLKCLNKEPHRRYTVAAALADDLRRFERGEPIAARRIGKIERGLRWLRRHPAVATALAAIVLLALMLAGVGLWWEWQRAAAVQAAVAAVEEELREAARFQEKSDFANAAAALKRAKLRIGTDGPPELHDRLTETSRNLELVTRLDRIRLDRVLIRPHFKLEAAFVHRLSDLPDEGVGMRDRTPPGRKYKEAFRAAGLESVADGAAQVAQRVAASPIREALVAALDDWAECAVDLDQRAWVLTVARLADPDSWRDRVRDADPAMWDDRAASALAELASTACLDKHSPQLLVALGARLRACGGNATEFLARVALAYPADFWANVELANALYDNAPLEAIGCYRTALVIRPEMVPLHVNLGLLYRDQGRMVEAITHFEHAARLDPSEPWIHNELGVALARAGKHDEAITRFREALRLDTDHKWAHCNLARILEDAGRLDEAIAEYRETVRLDAKHEDARQRLHHLLLQPGRGDELRTVWRQELVANPPDHAAWFGYAELCLFQEQEDEYRRHRQNLLARFGESADPQVAERTARACLLLPASDDELRKAVALVNRATAADRSKYQWAYPYFMFAKGLAEYRLDRFASAIAVMQGEAAKVMGPSPRLVGAMAQHRLGQTSRALATLAAAVVSFDWSAEKADNRDAWIAHVLRREAEAMIAPNLGTFLEGDRQNSILRKDGL